MDKYKSILFVVKKGQQYSSNYGCSYAPTGLRNSAEFVVNMLVGLGVRAKLVQVVDNNDIDREVYSFKPDIVVIEALWVVPEKFLVLKKLHPNVEWVVRIHSELPFLAQEGMAIEWTNRYADQDKVFVAVNSAMAFNDFAYIVPSTKLLYLPNFFPIDFTSNKKSILPSVIDISSFGAIRPLKNQLIQAVAAIAYADYKNKKLFFHINSSRVEHGDSVLRNIKALFSRGKHILVEHGWLDHKAFQSLVADMDISMCVSLTESFCIVAADTVSVGTPLVCSPEVRWASSISTANPTDLRSILKAMKRVTRFKTLANTLNQNGLSSFSRLSAARWKAFLKVK